MTDWDLRVPTPDQLRDFMKPTGIAFGDDLAGPEGDDWEKLLEPDRWLGAFESPESDLPVAGAAALTRRLSVPGGAVPVGAVTAVGVRPDYRRRGILTALMRRQLDDMHAKGEPLAALWASEAAIYQRFGYGHAAADGRFEVETSRTAYLRPLIREGRVRLVTEEEAPALVRPVFEAMHASTPGAIDRTDDWWRQVLADPEYSRRGLGPKAIARVRGRRPARGLRHLPPQG